MITVWPLRTSLFCIVITFTFSNMNTESFVIMESETGWEYPICEQKMKKSIDIKITILELAIIFRMINISMIYKKSETVAKWDNVKYIKRANSAIMTNL